MPETFTWMGGLNRAAEAIKARDTEYPVPVYYGIAEAPKGHGFPGAGTNRAHNLPLRDNPAGNADARKEFNLATHKLWLDATEIDHSVALLNQHAAQNRPREKDHPLAHRQVPTPTLPEPAWLNAAAHEPASAMEGIADCFIAISKQNPALRVRLGNPDEIKSNRMGAALELFQHRVTTPEDAAPEDVHGKVITALNEEAVINAVLGNKGGLNLLASYEAFMVKMLGAIRQELIFARHLCEAGRPPGWLTVPVIATSHTWENGKNEQSHQDTTFCEALLNEMTDVSRVLFPADWNSAIAALQASYFTHGQIWTLVIPKRPLPVVFSKEQAQQLAQYGAMRLRGNGNNTQRLQLVATGGYQLAEVLKASQRLDHAGVEHSVIYLQEPGRFRTPRDQRESGAMAPPEIIDDLFPESALAAAALALGNKPESYLDTEEFRAVNGQTDPTIILGPQIGQFGGVE